MIDNKAEKYYGTSPYTYALNNPILFLDPDGNDVKVSTTKDQETGRTIVTFNVTMSIRNSSFVDNSTVTNRASSIKSQIEQSFSGYDSNTNTEYRTSVTFDPNEENYVLDFVKELKSDNGVEAVGRVDEIGNTTDNTMKVLLEKGAGGEPNQSESETSRTGAHEYGHTLGLQHGETGGILKSKSEPNLMNKTKYTTSTQITNKQLDKGKTQAILDQETKIRLINNDKYSKNQY